MVRSVTPCAAVLEMSLLTPLLPVATTNLQHNKDGFWGQCPTRFASVLQVWPKPVPKPVPKIVPEADARLALQCGPLPLFKAISTQYEVRDLIQRDSRRLCGCQRSSKADFLPVPAPKFRTKRYQPQPAASEESAI